MFERTKKVMNWALDKDATLDGRTRLDIAIERRNPDRVKELALAGVNLNYSYPTCPTVDIFTEFSTFRHVIPLLLKKGLDINCGFRVSDRHGPQPTRPKYIRALSWCVELGDLEACRFLLENGAFPDPVDEDRPPLIRSMMSSLPQSAEIATLLLSMGACADGEGLSIPLIELVRSSRDQPSSLVRKKISALIDAGASIDGPPSARRDMTPLNYAPYYASLDVVDALLEAGADPKLPLNMERRPIRLAYDQKRSEIVTRLVDFGETHPQDYLEGVRLTEITRSVSAKEEAAIDALLSVLRSDADEEILAILIEALGRSGIRVL